MNRILVPVDFSAPSDWGFYYAYQLAKQFEAEIVALHLYRPPYVDTTMPPAMVQGVIKEREELMLSHLKSNTEPPLREKDHSVQIRHVVESWATASITEIAKRENVDLIVMGTHGADGAFDKVWGTNTSKVVAEAPCPVLAIPRQVEFHNLRTITYATDFDATDIDNITQLVLFAQMTSATVHVVHITDINGAESASNSSRREAFEKAFNEKFAGMNVSFTVRTATSVEDGLETFLRINHIDIVSMMTRKRNFWEKMFNNQSVTRSMAMRTRIPLLAFHK